MNNIKLFISTTGLLSPVIISDFGNRTFTHPITDYEITLEYTFEELFNSQDVIDHLVAGNITFKDEFGFVVTTKEELYQTSVKPVATRTGKIAGEVIPGHRAVIIENNLVYLFDPANINHYGRVAGISNNTANIGGEVEIITEGEILKGITFTPNKPYYAIANGVLTDALPTANNRQVIGFAVDTNNLVVRIGRPVKLI